MKNPFFLIGAEKAGTSTLRAILADHPEVDLAGSRSYHTFQSHLSDAGNSYREEVYADAGTDCRPGEKIAYALRVPAAPGVLHEFFPDADLVVSLRNPVDRAYSGWWMYHQRGLDQRTFEQAVVENLETDDTTEPAARRDEVPNYVREGHYAQQIERYRTHFSDDAMHVLLFERFLQDPEPVIKNLFSFLNVSEEVDVDLDRREKPSMGVIGRVASRFAEATGLIHAVPGSVRTILRTWIAGVDTNRPEMDSQLRERLVAHYRPHNRRLQELLDLDLSFWRETDHQST